MAAARIRVALSLLAFPAPFVRKVHGSFSARFLGTMQAVRVHSFGDPEVLKTEEVPVPEITPNQVLVKIEATGINPVETYVRQGNYARLPTLPFTPGNEGAGIVEAVGTEVTTVATGQRVYLSGCVSGTYAQYASCEFNHIRPLPDNVSFEAGAAVAIAYRTAYRALFQRSAAQAGNIVLVHGASGAVGLAAVQLCKWKGITVIGTASSAKGRQLVLEAGAEQVFNHSSLEYVEQIRDYASSNGGVDVIVEMLANVNLQTDLELVSRHGTVAIVGNRGSIEINPRSIMLQEANVVGVLGGTQAEWDLAYTAIEEGLAVGALKPIVGLSFTLAEAKDAQIEVIEHTQGTAGKIVLLPWADQKP